MSSKRYLELEPADWERMLAVNGVLLPVDGGNLALNAGGSHAWPAA